MGSIEETSTAKTGWLGRIGAAITIRTSLVAVLLLATLPMVALVCYGIFDSANERRAHRSEQLHRMSDELAQLVDRELQASIDALTLLANGPSLQRGDEPSIERVLAERPMPRTSWSTMQLLEPNGTAVLDATTRTAGRSLTVESAPWLGRVLETRSAQVSDLIVEDGEASDIAIAVPVMRDGALRYVLLCRIPVKVLDALARSGAASTNGFVALFDRRQRALARSEGDIRFGPLRLPASLAASGTASEMQRVTLEHRGDAHIAWQRVPSAGWTVGVGLPSAAYDQASARAAMLAFGTVAGCLLLGVGLALFVGRRVSLPLQKIGAGGAAAGPELREIATLRAALNAADVQAVAVRENLERKVREFETLFDHSPVALAFAQDADCRVVLRNTAMSQLLGNSGDDATTGERQRRSRVQAEMPLCRAAATGEPQLSAEIEVEHADGAPLWLLVAAVGLVDESGKPRGAIASMIDVTERRAADARLMGAHQRLRESQRLVEVAEAAGQVGFFDYQFGTDALSWTAGQARLLGISTGRLQGRLADLLEHLALDRASIEAELQRALAALRDKASFEYRIEPVDAPVRWLATDVAINYSEDGRPLSMVGFTIDATDRKRADEARAALMRQEQAARRQAEAADRAKDEFLAMLGHELRTPLSAISSAVDVLDRAGADHELATGAREIIGRQTRHLAHMMGDLLDVTRVLSGNVVLTRRPVDLAELAQHVVDTFTLTGQGLRHELRLERSEAWIDADATRIEQVVGALLSNALKFTPLRGEVIVSVRAEGDEAVLQVADSGPGIADDLLPRVFDLFAQGERPLDRRAGGLGLGLTLVRRLVELHGGAVRVDSSVEGSLFEVRLPLVAAPTRAASDAWTRSAASLHVLLIEDNEDALRSLQAMLALDGHIVSVSRDGGEGLTQVVGTWPDVAIVDIGLPTLDGYVVATRARAAGYAGRMIALSGYGGDRDARRAFVAGFDAHLAKPVDPNELKRLLIEA